LSKATLTVAIAGASGFIGSALVRVAVQQSSWRVLAVSRREVPAVPGAEPVRVDNYEDMPAADVVIDAAEPAIPLGDAAAEEALAASVARRFSGAGKSGFRHLVYCSTATVYGDSSDYPRRTDELVTPQTDYARRKYLAEQAALNGGGAVARLSNICGKGSRGVVADILAQIPGSGPLRIRNRQPVRDFLWIEDAARGLIGLVGRRGLFNLGTGIGTSIGDLAALCLRIAGEAHRPVEATDSVEQLSHLVLDVEEAARVCGWRAQVPLAAGLRKLLRP
jgi:nucleoside-diphosphate-sugar epimerase